MAGVTDIEAPDPALTPVPHAPLYHSHVDEVPKDPPFTDKVTDVPSQTVVALAVALVAAVEGVVTGIVT